MRVGVSHLQWPADRPFDQILAEIADIGFLGVEGAREYFGQSADLRTLLADAGLQMTAGTYAANWFDKEWKSRELDGLRSSAEFYTGVGAEYLVAGSLGSPHRFLTAGHLPSGRDDGLSDYQWELFAETISAAGEVCFDEFQLTLVFMNRAGTFVETREEIDRLISLANPETVYLAADTGQLFYGDIDPTEFFERNIDRIRYVHLKDVNADVHEQSIAGRVSYRDFVEMEGFPEVGSGAIDFEAVVEILKGGGYDGWLVIEQDYTSRDPAVAAGASLEHVNSLLGV
ncbi:MAG: TIM barrel protein [Gammaproteobacteria bacterium]|nr:TIM barrel protein [Gammaproteobacteria bacterium]